MQKFNGILTPLSTNWKYFLWSDKVSSWPKFHFKVLNNPSNSYQRPKKFEKLSTQCQRSQGLGGTGNVYILYYEVKGQRYAHQAAKSNKKYTISFDNNWTYKHKKCRQQAQITAMNLKENRGLELISVEHLFCRLSCSLNVCVIKSCPHFVTCLWIFHTFRPIFGNVYLYNPCVINLSLLMC